MLPIVSATLTVARCIRGFTIPGVAQMVGVEIDEVFDAETFLTDASPLAVTRISDFFQENLTLLSDGPALH